MDMKKLFYIFAILIAFSSFSFAVEFSNIKVSPNTTSAYLTWDTDVNCSAQVLYGKTISYGSTLTNSTKSFSHGAKIVSLTAGTDYHYLLKCKVNTSSTFNSSDQSFTTLESLPDLYIQSVSANPQNPTVGSNVTIKALVKNKGSGKATNATLSVICADGSTKSSKISSISSGGSSNVNIVCPSPSSIGTFTISATADSANTIRESDEQNNNASISITYSSAPKPDLTISDGDITHTLTQVSGKTKATLKVYVNNKGTAKASNVWLKVEGAGTTTYAKISSISAGGRGYSNIVLPVASGRFEITVDPNNTISESDESNNKAMHEISATEVLPDLVVEESKITHSPSSPKTGSSVSISAIIKNNGTSAAANVIVRFVNVEKISQYSSDKNGEMVESELNSGKLPGFGGIISGLIAEEKIEKEGGSGLTVSGPTIATVTVGTIPAGQTKTAKVTLVMPQDTSSLQVAVIADPDNAITELSKTNNMAIHTINIDQLYPDLSINESGITFPLDAKPGDKIKVNANIKNLGTLSVKNATVRYFVSVDGKAMTQFATLLASNIPSKGSKKVSADYTVPSNAIQSIFYIDINNDRKFTETNYSNNNASRDLKISLPDLELSGNDISLTGSVEAGKNVVIKANISNLGSAKAQSVPIGFYYMAQDGTAILIGTKDVTISSGGKAQATQPWIVPSAISPNQVIMVQANPNKTIYEFDFSNNVGTYSATAKMPDLFARSYAYELGDLIIPDAGFNGNYYARPMPMAVKNWGTADAKNVLVQVKDLRNNQVVNYTFANVPAGSNITFTHAFRVYKNDTPGYMINAIETTVDPFNSIPELGEENNVWPDGVSLIENQPPHAVADVDKPRAMTYGYEVLRNEWITFNCLNSTDPENPGRNTYYCLWDFGDGSEPEFGHEVYHYFTTPGDHMVSLNVTDSYGGWDDTAFVDIIVKSNQQPVPNAGGPYEAYTNQPITIDPSGSYDSDGSIVSMNLYLGDGTSEMNTVFSPVEHTYTSPGTYYIELEVVDDQGYQSATYRTEVHVTNPPPTETKTGTEYYVSHTYHSPMVIGSNAVVHYGIYKVDYSLKYTQSDHVIKSLTYTITSGPAIVDTVTSRKLDNIFSDQSVSYASGHTALQVQSVEIRDGNGVVLWSENGGPHVSGDESPRSMTYSGIDAQPAVWNDDNYVVINSEITYPGQMCAAEQINCQDRAVVWIFP